MRMLIPETYVEPDWLAAVAGTTFIYPCAYLDHGKALEVFGGVIRNFLFVDTNYPEGLNLAPALPESTGFPPPSVHLEGAINARERFLKDARGYHYRHLDPSRRIESYETSTGDVLTVVRKRGFGQMSLVKDVELGRLGVFMHRGDGSGEGGSGCHFLANRWARHEPCGWLLNKILERLADRALIVTDGSNTDLRQLRRHKSLDMDGQAAHSFYQGKDFEMLGFHWSCVGWLDKRYGPTLVWGLQRLSR